jgi:hypothetical protein
MSSAKMYLRANVLRAKVLRAIVVRANISLGKCPPVKCLSVEKYELLIIAQPIAIEFLKKSAQYFNEC